MDIISAWIIIGVGFGFVARGIAGRVGVPNPNQVIELVQAGEAFMEHQPKAREELRRTPPPKPAAVHFVVRTPEDGNAGVAQLTEMMSDSIHLGTPIRVQG